MCTRKARVLAVTKECDLIVNVNLDFGITIKKIIGFSDIAIDPSKENRQWLTQKLKFKNVEVEIFEEESGVYTGCFYLGSQNINQQLVDEKIAKESCSENYQVKMGYVGKRNVAG